MIIGACFFLSCAAQQSNILKYNDNVEAYSRVQSLNSKIFMETGNNMFAKYRLSIIEKDMPNAFVYPPKNTLVITKGLLDRFSDEEVTFVLCHEIAHVKLAHWEKNYLASQGINAAFQVLNVFIPGAGLGNLVLNPVVTRAYSRSQEVDADKEAVKMGINMNLSPAIYINTLSKLQRIAVENGFQESDRTGILDTHPNLNERISIIERESNAITTQAQKEVRKVTKKKEQYDHEIEIYTKSIEIDSQNADAYYNRANIYSSLSGDENFRKALNDYQSAAKLGHEKSQDYLKSKGIGW